LLSNTGSIALRLLEVQPPKTAATQSLWMSFVALSAKTVGSDTPSSVTASSCLPSTPPAALISPTASSSDLRTVVSLMDIVPDMEFNRPILTDSPEVSTHEAAVSSPPSAESTLLPHAVRPMVSAATRTAMAEGERRLVMAILRVAGTGVEVAARRDLDRSWGDDDLRRAVDGVGGGAPGRTLGASCFQGVPVG